MKKRYITLLILLLFILALPGQAATTISLNNKTLVVHQTSQATLTGTTGTVTWTSSNKKVATVNSKGRITAKKSGSAQITATVSGKSYKVTVKVITPSMSKTKKVDLGNKSAITIKNKKSFSSITYKSTNKKIATVTKKGKVKGIKTGTCYIKVCFNKSYTVKVKVKVLGIKTSSFVGVTKGSKKKLTPAHKGSSKGTYTVLHPSMGKVVNGVYTSKAYGWNQVVYKSGKYQHTFSIFNYCWEAHRGYTKVYPGNTLESIKAAKAAGAGSVEIDVRASRDGYFVLFHDSSVDETTNGALSGHVQNFYLSTLRKKNYIYKNGKTYHIATLEEALKLAKKLGLHVSVEMKTLPSKTKYVKVTKKTMTKRLCQTILKYGDKQTSIIVTSTENAKLLVKYSGGKIPVRITNDVYAKSSALRKIAKKYSYIMSTADFSNKYYKGYLQTLDKPY